MSWVGGQACSWRVRCSTSENRNLLGEAAGGQHEAASCRAGWGRQQRRMHGKALSAWLFCGSGHSVPSIWPPLILSNRGFTSCLLTPQKPRRRRPAWQLALPVISQLHLTVVHWLRDGDVQGFPSLQASSFLEVDPDLSFICLSNLTIVMTLKSHHVSQVFAPTLT